MYKNKKKMVMKPMAKKKKTKTSSKPKSTYKKMPASRRSGY